MIHLAGSGRPFTVAATADSRPEQCTGTMSDPFVNDPFPQARRQDGVLACDFGGEAMPMLLRYADVRRAAADHTTFSSDVLGRVTIPAEDKIRAFRQLPIESNPPQTEAFRDIVLPIFRRPSGAAFKDKVVALIDTLLDDALQAETLEVVSDFALPLQSRAMALLFNMPMTEAEVWIAWGTHAYRVAGQNDATKAAQLIEYISEKLDQAKDAPGDDLFGVLTRATIDGTALTRDQMKGFAHLAFSGGRDTVINSITETMRFLALNPSALDHLRSTPALIPSAVEELFRIISPISFIGRTCPHALDIHGQPVAAGRRVALGWASANFDETVFDDPQNVRLDRRPNPHLAFGIGAHSCLGSLHARLLLKSVLGRMIARVERIELVEETPNYLLFPEFQRRVGSGLLEARFRPQV